MVTLFLIFYQNPKPADRMDWRGLGGGGMYWCFILYMCKQTDIATHCVTTAAASFPFPLCSSCVCVVHPNSAYIFPLHVLFGLRVECVCVWVWFFYAYLICLDVTLISAASSSSSSSLRTHNIVPANLRHDIVCVCVFLLLTSFVPCVVHLYVNTCLFPPFSQVFFFWWCNWASFTGLRWANRCLLYFPFRFANT